MKILLKILVAPFALALSLLAALLVFLFDICAVLLTIASVILAVLGAADQLAAFRHSSSGYCRRTGFPDRKHSAFAVALESAPNHA